jgi:hypothetical protein
MRDRFDGDGRGNLSDRYLSKAARGGSSAESVVIVDAGRCYRPGQYAPTPYGVGGSYVQAEGHPRGPGLDAPYGPAADAQISSDLQDAPVPLDQGCTHALPYLGIDARPAELPGPMHGTCQPGADPLELEHPARNAASPCWAATCARKAAKPSRIPSSLARRV